MIECIFCENATDAKSIEHIVSESLGNTTYVMERGRVCDECNGRFSKFEADALSASVLLMERARLGIKTKKGKNAKVQVAELKIEGDVDFRKQFLVLNGLSEDNFEIIDGEKGIATVKVKNFNKRSTPNTKLLLKTGLEALFTSQRKIYKKYNFSELREFLLTKNNKDWPFVFTSNEATEFKSIPRFKTKLELSRVNISLSISEVDEETLLFKFKYGVISMVVNLLNRNTAWIKPYDDAEDFQVVFPDSFDKQLKRAKALEKATAIEEK
ncbi:HNH endonuclease [Pedobacter gandavensis]|uniref:HNH endonuclease n=1 Tax=Pedobacter gandavensis TaxID=2679963 RepID=UPI0024784DAB|nr:HNH endonuclease [Pedobacter gandavensis]WGQ10712.1 HNH endonuclease [Pedobacter gandavensis]